MRILIYLIVAVFVLATLGAFLKSGGDIDEASIKMAMLIGESLALFVVTVLLFIIPSAIYGIFKRKLIPKLDIYVGSVWLFLVTTSVLRIIV